MLNMVYVTVERPSVRPSVCRVDRWPAGLLLSALRAGDIDHQLQAHLAATAP